MMAAAHGAHGSTEFEFLDEDNFLIFNSTKNQFKWTGSVEEFESFMFQRLGLSTAELQTKCYSGTCVVWKTPNVTFNLYAKTKTLQVQGKAIAVEHT